MRLGYNTNGLQNHRLDDALRPQTNRGNGRVILEFFPDAKRFFDSATVNTGKYFVAG